MASSALNLTIASCEGSVTPKLVTLMDDDEDTLANPIPEKGVSRALLMKPRDTSSPEMMARKRMTVPGSPSKRARFEGKSRHGLQLEPDDEAPIDAFTLDFEKMDLVEEIDDGDEEGSSEAKQRQGKKSSGITGFQDGEIGNEHRFSTIEDETGAIFVVPGPVTPRMVTSSPTGARKGVRVKNRAVTTSELDLTRNVTPTRKPLSRKRRAISDASGTGTRIIGHRSQSAEKALCAEGRAQQAASRPRTPSSGRTLQERGERTPQLYMVPELSQDIVPPEKMEQMNELINVFVLKELKQLEEPGFQPSSWVMKNCHSAVQGIGYYELRRRMLNTKMQKTRSSGSMQSAHMDSSSDESTRAEDSLMMSNDASSATQNSSALDQLRESLLGNALNKSGSSLFEVDSDVVFVAADGQMVVEESFNDGDCSSGNEGDGEEGDED